MDDGKRAGCEFGFGTAGAVVLVLWVFLLWSYSVLCIWIPPRTCVVVALEFCILRLDPTSRLRCGCIGVWVLRLDPTSQLRGGCFGVLRWFLTHTSRAAPAAALCTQTHRSTGCFDGGDWETHTNYQKHTCGTRTVRLRYMITGSQGALSATVA